MINFKHFVDHVITHLCKCCVAMFARCLADIKDCKYNTRYDVIFLNFAQDKQGFVMT